MDSPNRFNRFQSLAIIGFKPVNRVMPARWRGGSALLLQRCRVPLSCFLLQVGADTIFQWLLVLYSRRFPRLKTTVIPLSS